MWREHGALRLDGHVWALCVHCGRSAPSAVGASPLRSHGPVAHGLAQPGVLREQPIGSARVFGLLGAPGSAQDRTGPHCRAWDGRTVARGSLPSGLAAERREKCSHFVEQTRPFEPDVPPCFPAGSGSFWLIVGRSSAALPHSWPPRLAQRRTSRFGGASSASPPRRRPSPGWAQAVYGGAVGGPPGGQRWGGIGLRREGEPVPGDAVACRSREDSRWARIALTW